MLQRLAVPIFLSVFSMQSYSASTLLEFSIPNVIGLDKVSVPFESAFESYKASKPGPKGSTIKYTAYRPNLDMDKRWGKVFAADSPIHVGFEQAFSKDLSEALEVVKTDLLSDKDVNRVDYVSLGEAPFKLNFSVEGKNVHVSLNDFIVTGRVRAKRGGPQGEFCGNTWIKFTTRVSLEGVYDIYSGELEVTNQQVSNRSNANCNRFPGKVADSIVDSKVKERIRVHAKNMIAPIHRLMRAGADAVRERSLLASWASVAANTIGYDLGFGAMDAISFLQPGLNVEFQVGVNRFGWGEHFLRITAYQDPGNFRTESYKELRKVSISRGKWGVDTTTKAVWVDQLYFECPSWAGSMSLYQLQYPNPAFTAIPVYGTNYMHQRGEPIPTLGSCTSDSGLSSFFSKSPGVRQ